MALADRSVRPLAAVHEQATMPHHDSILAFVVVSVVLALAPGPDNLFVLTTSAVNGAVAGLFVTLGLCTGLLIHISAVALGVAAMVQASTVAFAAIKTAGAVYLLYLAWQAFRANPSDPDPHKPDRLRSGKLYLRGIVMNVTNPKVAIFFLAFLPQFVKPDIGPVTPQVMVFGALFILSTLVVFGSVAIGAGALRRWFSKSAQTQKILNRIAGCVFAGLALKLLAAQR